MNKVYQTLRDLALCGALQISSDITASTRTDVHVYVLWEIPCH